MHRRTDNTTLLFVLISFHSVWLCVYCTFCVFSALSNPKSLPRLIIKLNQVSYRPRDTLIPILTDMYASLRSIILSSCMIKCILHYWWTCAERIKKADWSDTHSSARLWWSLVSRRFQQRLLRASRSWSRRRCRRTAPFVKQGRAGTKPRHKKMLHSKETLTERMRTLRRFGSLRHSWI